MTINTCGCVMLLVGVDRDNRDALAKIIVEHLDCDLEQTISKLLVPTYDSCVWYPFCDKYTGFKMLREIHQQLPTLNARLFCE